MSARTCECDCGAPVKRRFLPGHNSRYAPPAPEGMKYCPRCDQNKRLEEFNRDRSQKDGRFSFCRDCHQIHGRTSNRAYRRKHPERVAARNKQYETEHPERRAAKDKRMLKLYPEKAKARWAVNAAIREGKLEKPRRCGECDELTEKRHLHAHHADYSKPLNVSWLCRPCHGLQHRKDIAQEASDV